MKNGAGLLRRADSCGNGMGGVWPVRYYPVPRYLPDSGFFPVGSREAERGAGAGAGAHGDLSRFVLRDS
jgi:hypothetical protein